MSTFYINEKKLFQSREIKFLRTQFDTSLVKYTKNHLLSKFKFTTKYKIFVKFYIIKENTNFFYTVNNVFRRLKKKIQTEFNNININL